MLDLCMKSQKDECVFSLVAFNEKVGLQINMTIMLLEATQTTYFFKVSIIKNNGKNL
jgi:hypothetical protein